MNLEYLLGNLPPTELSDFLKISTKGQRFLRRAVLLKVNEKWTFLCCVLKGYVTSEEMPDLVESRIYSRAVLYEDTLDSAQAAAFIADLSRAEACIGDYELSLSGVATWYRHQVQVNNEYMARSGHVFGLRFTQHDLPYLPYPLLAPGQPYYPDIHEAARDWLLLAQYHGFNDGRHGQIIFMLPEARAFISTSRFTDSVNLELSVEGSETGVRQLCVQGAYWIGKAIHQLTADVVHMKAYVTIPKNASRIEIFLIDQDGAVFDYIKQSEFSSDPETGFGSRLKRLSRESRVREAALEGEGTKIEFKPFIFPDKPAKDGAPRSKLEEIILTAAAFANAEGGCIYMGIEDDCSISGIQGNLQVWSKSVPDEAAIQSYLGLIKTKIKDRIAGDIDVQVSHVDVDGAIVALIEIARAKNRPVGIHQCDHIYMRSSSTNRKVTPMQMASVLAAATQDPT